MIGYCWIIYTLELYFTPLYHNLIGILWELKREFFLVEKNQIIIPYFV